MQNKKEPYESKDFLSTKLKKLSRNSLDAGTFFLNAAVLSRKILVKAKCWIGTRYRHLLILNDSDRDRAEKNLIETSLITMIIHNDTNLTCYLHVNTFVCSKQVY